MLSKLAATFFPRHLRYQLALLTSLVLLLTVFVYAWYSANEQSAFAQNRAELQVVALAQSIAASSADAIIIKDFAGMESLLVRMVALPDIQAVRITDARGRLLSHVVRKPGGKPEVRFGARTIDTPAAANAATRINYSKPASGWRYQLGLGDLGRVVVWQPIFSGTLLGWVVVDYDLAATAEIRKDIWLDSLSAGTIALIASTLLLLLFLKRPMGALQTATNFAARLDESHGAQLPVFHGSSEIESLTTALNRASTRLLTQNRDLHNQKFALDQHAIVSVADLQGNITYANDLFCKVSGYSQAELIGKNHRIVNSGLHPPEFFSGLWRAISQGDVWHGELKNQNKDGGYYWVDSTIVPLLGADGRPEQYIAIRTDISAIKQAQEQLREKKQLLDSIIDNIPSMIFLKRASDLRFELFNRAGQVLLGKGHNELFGRNDYDFFPKEQADFFTQKDRAVLEQNEIVDIPEELINTPHGTRTLHTKKLTLRDSQGQPQYLLGIAEDITERQAVQKQIEFLAYHDALTDLPNRHLLQDRIQQALIHSRRNGNQGAVLFMDLDKFKVINDTLGHDVGDLLLKEVAQRLVSSVRSQDTVARTGGDEFIVVLHNVATAQDAGTTAQKLLDALLLPYRFAGKELHISASIGIAVFPDDGQDMDTLLKNSDDAMYHAKEAGRNNCQFFARQIN